MRVRFYAKPAPWRESGYTVYAQIGQWASLPDQGMTPYSPGDVMVGEFDLELGTPTRAELVAAEVRELNARIARTVEERNREIAELQDRIQKLLALEA